MSDTDTAAAISASVKPNHGQTPPPVSRRNNAPNDIIQLQKVLAEAAQSRTYVDLAGAGRHSYAGNASGAPDLTISTESLNRIISHEPADMTVTIEAGVQLDALQAILGEHGQFLPLDPTPGDACTVGGVLAANVSGPLRHRYGTARDWVLGLRVVLADGSLVKSGGRVVKNVSGYDLHKVFVGSLGTLGAIAEVTLKVAPLPRVDRTFVISCSSAAEATGVLMSAHEATLSLVAGEVLSPTAASHLMSAGAWTALVRVAGGAAATGRTADDLHELASLTHGSIDETTADVWSRWREHFSPSTLGLRISVLTSHVGGVVESLDRACAGAAAHISATASAGLIRLKMTPRAGSDVGALIERVRGIATQRGGFIIIDTAPEEYKRSVDVFGAARSDIEIMRRLKQQFDPQGILAPGRFVGRI